MTNPVRTLMPPFRLESYFSRWEFAARHHLTASDAQTLTVSELLGYGTDDDRGQFDELALGYTPTWGTARLREAIAGTYQRCSPDDVLVFAGAEEAIFWSMQVLAGPGVTSSSPRPTIKRWRPFRSRRALRSLVCCWTKPRDGGWTSYRSGPRCGPIPG